MSGDFNSWKSVDKTRAAARFKCIWCGFVKKNIGRCPACGKRQTTTGRPRKSTT